MTLVFSGQNPEMTNALQSTRQSLYHEELSGISTFECPLDIHVDKAQACDSLSLDPRSISHVHSKHAYTVLTHTEFYKNVNAI